MSERKMLESSVSWFDAILQSRYRRLRNYTYPTPDIVREKIEVISALHRIRLGSYGICETCDRLIPQQRLLALPQTRECLDCRNEFEVALRQKYI